MNKKSILIAGLICMVCSVGSFLVGYNLPHENKQEQASSDEAQVVSNKYEGVYISYTREGVQEKIYLNANNDCLSPDDSNTTHSCKWAVTDGRIVITKRGFGGILGKTQEYCETQANSQVGYEVVDISSQRSDGYICMASPITEDKYDILSDGSLSGNKVYSKRS